MTLTTYRKFSVVEKSGSENDRSAWEILGYEMIPDEEYEEIVLTDPNVQEGLALALQELEEWKQSLAGE